MNEKIKNFVEKPEVKAFAQCFVKGVQDGIVLTLIIVGGTVVVAAAVSAIQEKVDPEGFKANWISELEETLEKAKAS